ncbi:DUF3833 family protein [Jiella marina]|uniref:DUF3833 family protein n=1 Tax=Jiella sp. LLJ827 TaxID=2917712 RepID=UPI0021009795|nr:DUF3833 family protein [Jiella sp. LLJ827]MCQ0987781.1 DUF3833 domain-containing protein [Jiella sp. LLJ827]
MVFLAVFLGVLPARAADIAQSTRAASVEAAFSLFDFFDGKATSTGTITTAIFWTEEFTAIFRGRVDGRTLSLEERFHFDDGDRLQRWALERVAPQRYRGTVTTELGDGRMAGPVPVKGERFAQGVVLAYDGYAPGGGETLLGFRHVMRSQDDGMVENRVTISKFGLPIATSDVIFRRPGAAGPR